ncbi:motile sperm domain-containing protein 1-like isoform X2 [Pelobates fuscus]|uniref:motile sperm domain-containing protein 1-like isoform X2 n=1 Tax=Pelobates fuscus TaxID=191477 RepID=UPI002FE44A8D
MQRGVPGKVEGDEQRGSSQIPLPSTSQSPLPVFIFPPSLEFYADDQASHKQVLTLYNPFPCVLRYKVLSTAPLHYTVVDTEGLVKPNSCIDIVIRHRDVRVRHYGTTDKFRVEVWEEGSHKGAAGKKEITATLHPTKPENRERGSPEPLQWHPPSHMFSVRHGFPRPLSPGLFTLYVLMGMTSLVVLMLPLHGDPRTLLHEHLHVSVIQKLVAAYVLGLLTMVFLQG